MHELQTLQQLLSNPPLHGNLTLSEKVRKKYTIVIYLFICCNIFSRRFYRILIDSCVFIDLLYLFVCFGIFCSHRMNHNFVPYINN